MLFTEPLRIISASDGSATGIRPPSLEFAWDRAGQRVRPQSREPSARWPVASRHPPRPSRSFARPKNIRGTSRNFVGEP
jgi:hypothetical protein